MRLSTDTSTFSVSFFFLPGWKIGQNFSHSWCQILCCCVTTTKPKPLKGSRQGRAGQVRSILQYPRVKAISLWRHALITWKGLWWWCCSRGLLLSLPSLQNFALFFLAWHHTCFPLSLSLQAAVEVVQEGRFIMLDILFYYYYYFCSEPIRLEEPCEGCAAPYGYHHIMPLTTNAATFAVSLNWTRDWTTPAAFFACACTVQSSKPIITNELMKMSRCWYFF